VAEELALRRPVAVIITADVAPVPEPTPIVSIVESPEPLRGPALETHDERTFDVPVRLSLVPSRA